MDLEKQQLAVAAGIGELLAAARVKSGLSILEVASQLHLKQSFIIALESSDYHVIGSMVYVKGYLRTYARLLRVDIEHDLLILQPDNASLTHAVSRSAPILTRHATKWNPTFKKIFWLVFVLIIAALVVYFWPTSATQTATTPAVSVVNDAPKVPLPNVPAFKAVPVTSAPSAKAVPEKRVAKTPSMSMTASEKHSESQSEDSSDD